MSNDISEIKERAFYKCTGIFTDDDSGNTHEKTIAVGYTYEEIGYELDASIYYYADYDEFEDAVAGHCSLCTFKIMDYEEIDLGEIEPPFRRELEKLVNKHCMEKGSDTPDAILAEYLYACLSAFDRATLARSQWYSKNIVLKADGRFIG